MGVAQLLNLFSVKCCIIKYFLQQIVVSSESSDHNKLYNVTFWECVQATKSNKARNKKQSKQ